jgi:hypothetical protein
VRITSIIWRIRYKLVNSFSFLVFAFGLEFDMYFRVWIFCWLMMLVLYRRGGGREVVNDSPLETVDRSYVGAEW